MDNSSSADTSFVAAGSNPMTIYTNEVIFSMLNGISKKKSNPML
jgi:hypothetical protein